MWSQVLRNLTGTVAFVVAASMCTAAVPALDGSDVEGWLDGAVPYGLHVSDIAGAVVVVVKDHEVLLEKGYGYADIAKHTPMDPMQTGIGVGSVSKLFTWTAVMQLVQAGKLDLDRNINDYLDFKIPDAFGKPVTMRNLMTHTAGFEEMMKTYITSGEKPRDLGAYLRAVPAPERIFPPGQIPAYSNYGATLAGYIVERLSGEPFPAYIEHHVLEPLAMDRSTFEHPLPPALAASLAKFYRRASSPEPLPESANIQDPSDDPAGSLVSTADDISHFMLAI